MVVPNAPPDDGLITVFACELGRSEEQLKSEPLTEQGQVSWLCLCVFAVDRYQLFEDAVSLFDCNFLRLA